MLTNVGDDQPVLIEDEAEGEVKQKKLPARAIRNDDGTVTLPLLKPVTIGFKSSTTAKVRQETTSELTFHELTGADLRIVMQQTPDMQPVALLARSARIAINRMTPLFDRMAQRDISAATDIVSFLSE